MKKIYTILCAVLITASVFAQSPQKMSYQAVIRNSSDQLVVNTQIGMQISILQASETGSNVYTEIQTPTTNANGLVSIEIGGGAGFIDIDWANGPYFIKTETDPSGGTNYSISGTSELLSVPFALYSLNGTPGPQGLQGLPGVDGANGIDGVDGVDGATGPAGADGATGPTGADGAVGPAGPAGADGKDGIDGAVGPTGPAGAIGIDGVDGAVGETGATGPAGADGKDGLTTSVNGVTQVNGAITLTKSHLGLADVDNTSDLQKPISNATQTALMQKAPLASPIFTGTISTSGALTTGAITYPSFNGTYGQVLTTDGMGTATWATPAGVSLVDNSITSVKYKVRTVTTNTNLSSDDYRIICVGAWTMTLPATPYDGQIIWIVTTDNAAQIDPNGITVLWGEERELTEAFSIHMGGSHIALNVTLVYSETAGVWISDMMDGMMW